MKKFTAILLTVIMVASLFTSCSNSIAPNIDETVSVSFDESTSRSLTASLVPFDKDDYFWTYAARKTDDTGLISGQTQYNADGSGSVPVKASGRGLGSVPGFSQGSWKFMLFAYADQDHTQLVYSGENLNVVLKKGNGTDNSVIVKVSPVPSGEGTLVIDDNLTLRPQKADVTFNSNSFTKFITIKTIGESQEVKYTGTDKEHTLEAGSYLVQVDFVKNDITYASGSVVATVFSNMTTTVGGYLDELITHAAFDSEINPDVMNKSVYSSSVDKANVPDTGVTIKKTDTSASAQDDSKVTATVTKDAASAAITSAIDYAADNGVSNATETNTSVAFELKVNTTNATSTSLEYEIGMNALITVKEGNNTKQLTQDISRFTQYVTVTIDIQKGLSNVVVTHDSNEMLKLNSNDQSFTDESAPDGAYFYDATAGKLYIKTKTFSPFSINYDAVKYVARVGEANYSSLQDAVNAVSDNGVINVLQNLTLPSSLTIDNGKVFTIDFGGYTITGGISLKSGFVSLSNGVISHSYCPIYVYTTDTDIVYNSLTIEEDMTVTGGDNTYGLIVYQKSVGENNYGSTVNIKGKIKDVNSIVWVMGNIKTNLETASNPVRINILNGAELSSEGTGISENGSAIITVSDNSKIESSEFAIEVRAGKLEIEGGTFTATATPSGSESNGSGSSTSGAAIAISQHQTTLPISVNITGGDFSGYTAFYQSSPETNSDSSKLSLSIEGGSFVSTNIGDNATAVYSEDCTGFITGGTFSSNPSEYVASGYEAIESEGQWIVSRKVLAKIGDNSYYTLEEAIAAATDGATIILTSDIEKTVSSVKGSCYAIENKSITIDGQNHELTLTGSFENDKAEGTEAYGIKISGTDSNQTVTLQNMEIKTSNIQRAVRTEGEIGITIDNCAILTNGCGIHVKGANKVDIINNSTFTVRVVDNSKFSAHLRTAVMVGAENANVIVDGCTINAVNNIKTTDKNTLCKGLYVGTFSKDAKITAKNTSVTADYSIAIDGAQNDYTTFEEKPTQIVIESGNYSGLIGSPSGLSYKSLTINGGTFSDITNLKSFNGKDDDVAKLVISGGTFPFEPDNKYISEGYKAIDQGNGTWTVTQDSSN